MGWKCGGGSTELDNTKEITVILELGLAAGGRRGAAKWKIQTFNAYLCEGRAARIPQGRESWGVCNILCKAFALLPHEVISPPPLLSLIRDHGSISQRQGKTVSKRAEAGWHPQKSSKLLGSLLGLPPSPV